MHGILHSHKAAAAMSALLEDKPAGELCTAACMFLLTGVWHVQVASQQGKYLAQVLKDNPLVLQPGPNGPTIRGVGSAVIPYDEPC